MHRVFEKGMVPGEAESNLNSRRRALTQAGVCLCVSSTVFVCARACAHRVTLGVCRRGIMMKPRRSFNSGVPEACTGVGNATGCTGSKHHEACGLSGCDASTGISKHAYRYVAEEAGPPVVVSRDCGTIPHMTVD